MKKEVNKKNKLLVYLVYFQIFLAIISGVLFIIYLFNNKYLFLMQMFFGLTLLLMSYISHKIYHKNNFIWISLVFFFFLIINSLLNYFGVL